jgi:lipoprotein LprG
VLAALAGCGSSQPQGDPRALLQQAKRVIDSAESVHFSLRSSGASGGSGVAISAADGDARRPDGFSGTLTVLESGFTVKVQIVSAGGTFYALLPFSSRFQVTDPSKYGFGNPATLLDTSRGLSSLLVEALSARMDNRDRLQGEELDEVDVTLPGQRVKDLLTSADPSKPVSGRIGIAVDSHQIRRVVLTGPFFDAGTDSTYTLVLDRYGENVTITPPA